ncbi:hypothetical protein [uncultured Kocuria sp.]|uniref:hypothetical protein n=1 Tax=uncultured Kocuria sp. TaxID=259305 RepID=UPI002599F274|nr:hypothetical protein [uncultured Kocuria sp.]MCT1368013.1 hypothetical protein [Rothia sp. p3-SID1597]
MISKIKRTTSILTASAVIASGLFGATALTTPSMAACNGSNSRDVVSADPMGGETHDVKIDSCKVQELIDGYSNVKDAAGLTGLLGAAWWPAGVVAGTFFGWAWANQSAVKDCAKDGKGVSFTEVNGIVTSCSAQ